MQHFPNMGLATSIKVVSLHLRETGTYNEQFRRPYETELTGEVTGQILNNLQSEETITPAMFSGVVNQFIRPTAAPEASILIPEGWGTKRMLFILKVQVTDKFGTSYLQCMTGWTETPDVNLFTGSIDPQMVFHINNVVQIRSQLVNQGFGNVQTGNVIDCSHVLIDDQWQGIYQPNGRKTLLRPEDLYSSIGVSMLSDEIARSGSFDGRSALMNQAKKSRRANGVASNYVSDVVTNFVNAANIPGTSAAEDPQEVITNARQYAREGSADRDPFMQAISTLNGGLPVSDRFTYQELCRLDPETDRKSYILDNSLVPSRYGMHQAGQTAFWNGQDRHTQVAVILSNSVPSLMMMHTITRMSIFSTNMDFTGRITTRIGDVAGLVENMDMTRPAQAFIARFEKELLPDISYGGQVGFGIQMIVDLLGETRLTLTLDGTTYDYATPSFCDAMFAPVITSNTNLAHRVVDDFRTVLEQATDLGKPGGSGAIISLGQTSGI